MSYTITNIKSELSGVLHGTTTNQITGLDNLIYRAARDVLLDVDPNETIRIVPITNSVFNSIYDYSAPDDLKGNGVIDIRPQVNRQGTDIWTQAYNQAFDVNKLTSYSDNFTINWDSSVKTIRINAPSLTSPIQINTCDSLTNNGTWAVTSNATDLVADSVNYVSSSGSLQFDLTADTPVLPATTVTGYIENSTMTSVDLSDWLNQGTIFLYTFLPTGSVFSNVNLRWGSSATNYYSVDATTTQAGTTFQNGWNLLQFNWSGATVTGSPDSSAINYIRVTWTYDGTAQTAVRLDQITAALGTILEIEYYSKFLFRTSAGTWQETVTDDTNIINLDTESYNLLVYKVAQLAVQQQQGIDAAGYDGKFFKEEYDSRLERYYYLYKSQKQKPSGYYYKVAKPYTRANPTRRGF